MCLICRGPKGWPQLPKLDVTGSIPVSRSNFPISISLIPIENQARKITNRQLNMHVSRGADIPGAICTHCDWKLLLGIALLGQARDNRIIDGAGETRRRTGCAMGRRADSIYVFSGSAISSGGRKPSRVFFPSSSRSAGAMALTSMTRRARISVAISSKASRSFWSRSSIAFHLVWSISRGSPSRVSKTEQILFSKKPILNWNHAPRLLQLEKAHCHDDRVDAGAEGEDPAVTGGR